MKAVSNLLMGMVAGFMFFWLLGQFFGPPPDPNFHRNIVQHVIGHE
jgi:hypothetical protein